MLENLVLLCRAHHTLVHEGGFRVEVLPTGGFLFVRPEGQALLSAPPLVEATSNSGDTLEALWIPPWETFSPDVGRSTWEGEPVDYDWAVDSLRWQEGRDTKSPPRL